MYREGSLMTAVKEISKYKLELVEIQEVKWDRGGTEPAGEYGKGNENRELSADFFVHKRIISAAKRV
jgi:hypothetical protein